MEENIQVDDWDYKSDNEEIKFHVGQKLHSEILTRNEMLIYFTEIWSFNKEKYLRTLLKCDSEGNINVVKNKDEGNIEKLVDDAPPRRPLRILG